MDPNNVFFTVTGKADDSDSDTDIPEISDLKLSDDNVDRTAGETGLFLSFNAKDESGFNDAYFSFSQRDGTYDSNDPTAHAYAYNSLVNGSTIYAGSFISLLEIHPASKAGTYNLDYFSLEDELGNRKYYSDTYDSNSQTYSWDAEATETLGGVDPNTVSFTVTGESVLDSDIPTISNFALSRTTIDRSAGTMACSSPLMQMTTQASTMPTLHLPFMTVTAIRSTQSVFI